MIGYARISTPSQNLDAQIDNLKGAGCVKIFTDTVSGTKTQRNGWDEMMAYIRSGDVLVITELSRMSRSLSHLLEIVEDLKARQVDLKSLRENIDTSSATGRAFLSIRVQCPKWNWKSNRKEQKPDVLLQRPEGNPVEGQLLIQTSSNKHESFTKTLINPPERFVLSSVFQDELSSNTLEKSNNLMGYKTKKVQNILLTFNI